MKTKKVILPLTMDENCLELIQNTIIEGKQELKITTEKNSVAVLFKDQIIAQSNNFSFNKCETISTDNYEAMETDLELELPADIFNDDKLISEALVKEALNKGYDREKIDLLHENRISEELFTKIIEQYDFKVGQTIKKPKTLYLEAEGNDEFKSTLIQILEGEHVLLIGPKSTGKNTLIESLCWILGKKFIRFPGSPYADKTDLVGDIVLKSITNSEGKATTVTMFQEKALIKAMREGYILILDEINVNNPSGIAILNGPMDESRSILLDTGEVVTAHKDFRCIGTMNEAYEGRNKMDASLIDRMATIHFKSTTNFSKILKVKYPDTPKEVLDYIDTVVKKVNKIVSNNSITEESPCSIRSFTQFIKYVKYGMSLDEAVTKAIIGKLQNKDNREVLIKSLNIC